MLLSKCNTTGLVAANLIKVADEADKSREDLIRNLFNHRRLPAEGWDDLTLRRLLNEAASADFNQFMSVVGAGEREGRVYSSLVRERHLGFAHGIGRSGDVMAEQPKAAGSSLLNKLTQRLALDALHLLGLKALSACLVLPVATGMALMLVFLRLKQTRPPSAKYVIWSRIDQKSCLKSIITSGCEPVVVELRIDGDSLKTDEAAVENAIESVGAQNVVCVVGTTSTFAPRTPDNIPALGKLCYRYDVPLVVNNAYGLHCRKCCHLIQETAIGAVKASKTDNAHPVRNELTKLSPDAPVHTGDHTAHTGTDDRCSTGMRLDFVVQSTDKNFMVPVGGAIVASPHARAIAELSASYPGRASFAPTMDLLITLLQMGSSELLRLRNARCELASWFSAELRTVAEKLNCRVLDTPQNCISFAVCLNNVPPVTELESIEKQKKSITAIGASLYHRRCSGARVVLSSAVHDLNPSAIGNCVFRNYGAHSDLYPHNYITLAVAIGATKAELVILLQKILVAFK